jgi:quercetin dioxygenase-like cupin family protein
MSRQAADDPRALSFVPPDAGQRILLGALPMEFKTTSALTSRAYFMVEQPIAPRLLVAPHVHRNEDQVSYVLEGTLGFRVGDEEILAPAGSAVFRPRGVPHSLWNPNDEPARMLEITSPGDVEAYFRRFGALSETGMPDPDAIRSLAAEYGIAYVDEWVPELSQRHGVTLKGGFWRD